MKRYYPVLVEKKEDTYYAHYPGLENLVIERVFNDTLDDTFEDARYALCDFFFQIERTKTYADATDIPEPLNMKDIDIPNGWYFCMMLIDTEWFYKTYIDIVKYDKNPYCN